MTAGTRFEVVFADDPSLEQVRERARNADRLYRRATRLMDLSRRLEFSRRWHMIGPVLPGEKASPRLVARLLEERSAVDATLAGVLLEWHDFTHGLAVGN